jgi:hypothetical protein
MILNVKHLNRVLIVFILLMSMKIQLSAQQISGIYMNGNDFNSGRLSFAKAKGKKCRVRLHESLYRPVIHIKYCDSEYSFNKDSVFGYRDLQGNDHRFYNKEIYQVLNRGEEILIYKIEKTVGGLKNPVEIVNYYFSINANSPVYLLTARNLERCFQDNRLFLEYIEVHFRSDNDLMEYDTIHNKYKLNSLLELSRKSK